MDRSKKKISALAVAEIIFIVILALIMIAMIAFNFLFKNKTAPVDILGTSFYHTKAVTMLPKIPQNTLIIAKASEIDSIVEGSVVICKIGDNTVLIRVKQIQQEEGQTYYVVKFDSAGDQEYRIERDAVIAKAVQQSETMGSLINFASSTPGIIIAVVIPLVFIIAIQVARILSIQKLENEAASIDDIDELISARDEDESAPVTFTEPKFIEDVTGKIPKPSAETLQAENGALSGVTILPEDDSETEEPAGSVPLSDTPLFTYDRIAKDRENRSKEPVMAAAANIVSHNEAGETRHSHIEIERKKTPADEFFENYSPKSSGAEVSESTEIPVNTASPVNSVSSVFEKGKPIVFTPHLTDVIPGENESASQKEASASKKPSTFDESVKAYYEKTYVPETPSEKAFAGENAVLPKEPAVSPAPAENAVSPKAPAVPQPKKNKNSNSFADLMDMINAEEAKLKK